MAEDLSRIEQFHSPPGLMLELMARRSALITGDERLNPFGPTTPRSMRLDIAPQPEPRIAELVIDHEPQDDIPDVPVTLTIGTFHAHNQQWKFFPELVRIYEINDVRWGIEGLDRLQTAAYAQQAAELQPTIDYAHPATQAARSEMFKLLTNQDTGKEIIDRVSADPTAANEVDGAVTIDDATDMYLTSYLRFIDGDTLTRYGFVQISALVHVLEARFHGLRIIRNPGNVIRGFAKVPIAFAEADNPDNWVPSNKAVTADMWSRISDAPGRLQAFEARVSGFTPAVCAVAANWDTPL